MMRRDATSQVTKSKSSLLGFQTRLSRMLRFRAISPPRYLDLDIFNDPYKETYESVPHYKISFIEFPSREVVSAPERMINTFEKLDVSYL